MQRISINRLESQVRFINEQLQRPVKPWERINGRNVAQIGNFHLSQAYGGVCLHEMTSDGGGVRDVFSCGHVPKRELHTRMASYLDGIQAGIDTQL